MTALGVEGLSKSFGNVHALHDVSLAIGPGEIRAICGENGAGKSTLVKMITGIIQPDRGVIRISGEAVRVGSPQHGQRLGLGLVSQELSLAPQLSILDNIWLGSPEAPLFGRSAALRQRALEAMEALGAAHWDLDRPIFDLSIGERQIVEIARLLARRARVLILDEPTATLSDPEIEKLLSVLRRLKTSGHAIIYITHRLAEVFQLCDTVTVLRNGRHVMTNDVATVTRESLIEHMLGRPLGDMYPPAGPSPSGEPAILVKALCVPGHIEPLTFEAQRGRITCFAGQIGSGAAMVTRAIAGLAPAARGEVRVDGRLLPLGSVPAALSRNVLFVSEDRAEEGIFHDMRVLDNLVAPTLPRHARGPFVDWRTLGQIASELAARVGVDPDRLLAQGGTLSGGNQQKLLFGRALGLAGPSVILMNEPTRGVDVGARAEIYRLMRLMCDLGYALVMTSSDLEEIVGMGDTIYTLFRGRLVGRHERPAVTLSSVLADIIHPEPKLA